MLPAEESAIRKGVRRANWPFVRPWMGKGIFQEQLKSEVKLRWMENLGDHVGQLGEIETLAKS